MYIDEDGWIVEPIWYCHLNDICKEKHISIDELANKTFLQKGMLIKYANNKCMPNLRTAFKIAETLEMSIDDIWIKEK